MKKLLFICIILFFIVYSFFYPELMVNAAKNGIQIWFLQILPALLPFTVLSSVLVKSNFLKSFQGNANLIACVLTLVCGFVFGFPVGAKLSADFYKQNILSEKQATILSITTNNFSPMYVCGFAMPLLFSSPDYNQATYVLLYLIPLVLVSIYLMFHISKDHPLNISKRSEFHMDMQVMDFSIINGFEALIKICGYIVLFSIVTAFSMHTISNIVTQPQMATTLLLGNLEITNGIKQLSTCNITLSIKYIVAIQLLSFGGLSGIAQTGSILSDARLSIHKYIIGKAILSLLLTLLSVIYVFFSHLL